MTTESQASIRQKYLDPKTGLTGVTTFAQRHHIPLPQAFDALRGVEAATLNAPVRRRFARQPIYVHAIDELWASDLMDVSAQAPDNQGVKFLLVVIDAFSKYLWVVPLKNKTAAAVTAAFKSVFAPPGGRQGRVPTKLWTDQGSEFYNQQMKNLLASLNISHYHTYNETKSALAERVIRTLRQRLARLFDARGTFSYLTDLPDVVANYNSTRHSAIKMTPDQASLASNQAQVLKTLQASWARATASHASDRAGEPKAPKFAVGQTVRITRHRGIFTKESVGGWTQEIFTISQVHATTPPTYNLSDYNGDAITGRFYEAELQRADPPEAFKVEEVLEERGRGKNKEYLVKWLGYPESFNSWVKAKDFT